MARTTTTTTDDKTPTATTPAKASKPQKMLHHAYHAEAHMIEGVDRLVFAEVVTFGTRTAAIEHALPRKWDVVSGLPGVPLSELVDRAAQP